MGSLSSAPDHTIGGDREHAGLRRANGIALGEALITVRSCTCVPLVALVSPGSHRRLTRPLALVVVRRLRAARAPFARERPHPGAYPGVAKPAEFAGPGQPDPASQT